MLELQRVAVEVYCMVFLSLCTRKLIHDTAHHTCVLMLARLTDECQLCAVFLIIRILPTHLFRERTRCYHFHRCTAAQTGTGRYIAIVEQVISAAQLCFRMTTGNNLNAPECIVTPGSVRLRGDGINCNLIYLRHIQRTETKHLVLVLGDQQPCAETQCARKHTSTVVIGVLTD